jgi:hypothetical protein
MPGFDLMTVSSTVMCSHGGQATAPVPNVRVKVMGQPTLTAPCQYMIAGCAFPPPPAGNGPCVSATWSMGATRVKSNGMPVLLANSAAAAAAICVPTGTPLQVIPVPGRVKGM